MKNLIDFHKMVETIVDPYLRVLCRVKKFQHVLWKSSSPILLAWGNYLLVLVYFLLENDLPWPLSIGQVSFKNYLPSENNLHSTCPGTFFKTCYVYWFQICLEFQIMDHQQICFVTWCHFTAMTFPTLVVLNPRYGKTKYQCMFGRRCLALCFKLNPFPTIQPCMWKPIFKAMH